MTATKNNAKPATKPAKVKDAFQKMLDAAIKHQNKGNTLWHDCQKAAVRLAVEHRNLSALTRLVHGVQSCKSLRARELVQFILFLAGDETGGEKCALVWKKGSDGIEAFTFKKGKDFRPDAVTLSDSQAWFDWAKPDKLNVVEFKSFYAMLRKMQGDDVVITAKEKELLKAVTELTVKMVGAEVLESKRGK